MFRFRRAVTVAAAAGALALVGVPAAMATTPTDGPTVGPSQNFVVNPHPVRHLPLRPEQFNVVLTSTGVNTVNASGPISGHGFDITNTPVRDTFRLGGLNSVRVNHTASPAGVVNLATCTVSLNQIGTWSFQNGTGAYAHAIGHGSFALTGLFAFPNRPYTSVCALTGQTPAQIAADVAGGGLRPTFYAIAVHGSGQAAR